MNDLADLKKFAKRYAAAWCSQNLESVASFFAENGTLSVNDGPPAVGRAAITEIARGFMRTFPDMVVTMDDLKIGGRSSCDAAFHWTLTGTSTDRAARENAFESAATNFGRSTMEPAGAERHGRESPRGLASREASQSMTDSLQNRRVISTARSTNISSNTLSMASSD